ncbi:MAG: DUF3817 domain-containing protein [Actinomycetota bacterium]|nr:DUF3817 domain-containing protein [Actinomycetota bacterium]
MKSVLLRYRVMANVVGILLIPLVLGFLGKLVTDEGTLIHDIGEKTEILGVLHGWLYMIFLVMAALLARAAKWTIPFTIVTLLAGTIPFVSFWAEHRATKAVKAAHPDLINA